ncbi:Type 1 glutamine amidotransferase-like domain-containing protein [Pseudonocardia sp. DLS-67]
MRLLLSSWFLGPGERPQVLPPATTARRAGIVLNALDAFGPSRARDFGREADTWEAFGYRCEELDLREYFADRDGLAARLSGLDLVWAMGGNAFVLARAMTGSGFGAAVREQLDRPDFGYGGYSAGACVAGPDLRGIDLVDDPAVLPDGYPPSLEPRCLGLVDFRIVPHWRSDHPDAPGAERAAARLTADGLAHRCLRDGETMSVHDGTVVVSGGRHGFHPLPPRGRPVFEALVDRLREDEPE